MKIIGNVVFVFSALWVLGIFVQPFRGVPRVLVRPWPHWLNWVWRLPDPPPPMNDYTWANSWPSLLGLCGFVVATVLIMWAHRRDKMKGRDEI